MIWAYSTMEAEAVTVAVGSATDPLSVVSGTVTEALVPALLGGAALVLSLGLLAQFSLAERSLLTVSDRRVESMVVEGVEGAELVAALRDDRERLRAVLDAGSVVAGVATVALTTGLLALALPLKVAIPAAIICGIALIVLVGEASPGAVVDGNAEAWALTVARPVQVSAFLLHPLLQVIERLTDHSSRVGGDASTDPSGTQRDPIHKFVEWGENEGVITQAEREHLQRILRFSDTIAKEAMTPRLDIVGVSKETTVDEAFWTSVDSGHSKVPVYAGTLDNVVGFVTLRDLAAVRVEAGENADETGIADHVRQVPHVPESKNVDELLAELQEARAQMAIVVDEFGTTEGLITVEDLAEEVVGDILDVDEAEPIEFVSGDTVLVQGDTNVDDVNETLGIDLPEAGEFETIAGFIFNRAGRLVETGETFAYGDVRLRVERMDVTRILEVSITCEPQSPYGPSGEVRTDSD